MIPDVVDTKFPRISPKPSATPMHLFILPNMGKLVGHQQFGMILNRKN
jgi:hypothetical protein